MFLDSIMQHRNIYNMRKYFILLPILSLSFVFAQEEEEDINLDDLWDTTVWEEIEEINEVEGEVEQVVTVAVSEEQRLRMRHSTTFIIESP